jgi:hypothetical protein
LTGPFAHASLHGALPSRFRRAPLPLCTAGGDRRVPALTCGERALAYVDGLPERSRSAIANGARRRDFCAKDRRLSPKIEQLFHSVLHSAAKIVKFRCFARTAPLACHRYMAVGQAQLTRFGQATKPNHA